MLNLIDKIKNDKVVYYYLEKEYAGDLSLIINKKFKNIYVYIEGENIVYCAPFDKDVWKDIFEDKEMFRVTIPLLRDESFDEKDLTNLANDTLNVGVNVGVNKTQKEILKLIQENKNITQKEIASKLKTTLIRIERNIIILKDKNILERVGANKNGYWKILKR